MKIFYSLDDIRTPFANAVVTIGNFDGVHLGHREIFRTVQKKAQEIGGLSVVVTFVPHPLKVLAPAKAPLMIDTPEEKEFLIGASGIDVLVSIPFTREFAAVPPEDFVKGLLVERIGLKHLVIGYDYAFGRDRRGNVDLLRSMGSELGFEVTVLDPIGSGGTVFSSSVVRSLIAAGKVEEIVSLLGRHFSLGGTVIHGHQRGKGLGFPTANIETDKELLPGPGVYAVKVRIGEGIYDGACNIGTNPTFNDGIVSIEAFLFDFEGDLYGREIRVYFIERLRDERRFPDPQALVAQIAADVARAREILGSTSIIEYRDYPVSHPETPDVTPAVSDSKTRNFSS